MGSSAGKSRTKVPKHEDLGGGRTNKSHFEFEKILAYHKFGVTWKVKHKGTKKYYSLKEISKIALLNSRKQDLLINEFNSLKVLKNSFIMNLRFAFQDTDHLYMAYDYLSGGSLRYHLDKNKTLNEEQSRFIVTCILSCLEFLHSQDIVHGQISPENLIFDENGYIHLTDFEAARIVDETPYKSTVIEKVPLSGELCYYAPEYILKKNIGKTVDYFSVGMITYEMMIGEVPLMGKGRKEIIDCMNKGSIQVKKSDVPEEWSFDAADFVNKLIQKLPENRLGFGGFNQIRQHAWLKNIPWQKVTDKILEPPYQTKEIKTNNTKKTDLLLQSNPLHKNEKDVTLLYEGQTLFSDFYFVDTDLN